ncbi:MAG: ABC transporter permease [Victivallaceae bacterium]|nr:ABC transporter permease [Victivallaceae bacterium]
MLAAALLVIYHTPSAALYVFSEQLKLVVDTSMATALVFGLVAAALTAGSTVTREMRNGTVLLLLSKPVSRPVFVLGKIAGIGVASVLFTVLCTFAAVVAVYIAADQFRMDMQVYFLALGTVAAAVAAGMIANFLRGSAFAEVGVWAIALFTAGLCVYCCLANEKPALAMGDFARALALIALSIPAMSTLAVALALGVDVVANLLVCSAVFFAGLVSGFIFHGPFYREMAPGLLKSLFDLLYSILPNWQYFWLADAVAVGRPIPGAYVVWAAVYSAVYTVIAAMWAVAVFRNREAA